MSKFNLMDFRSGNMITLMGRVPYRLLTKMGIKDSRKVNELWFYVDFTSQMVKLNSIFDTLFEGDEKKLLRTSISSVKLLKVFDQYGHPLDKIPSGYKTICKFSFSPHIPSIIKTLPIEDGFKYNSHALKLANHSDVAVGNMDRYSKPFLRLFYEKIIRSIRDNELDADKIHENRIPQIVFISHSRMASNEIELQSTDPEEIIRDMVQAGLIRKHESEKELEMV